ncbi:hypothetical protein CWATWH0402_4214 [Crocosphaera watsonii WH 0402]|uniref:Uncharacterized protein n=1 Tax=Crocosphaera watsonii WH 0402 TaxID=1284629 RepID=T2JXF8_CROWT|nr:hypothetical protein [Crocosphaera watsonii]CCQ69880.1 hypothetical protein CWATWH0402_4214 [Crocosphaera watsonii WH 0402]
MKLLLTYPCFEFWPTLNGNKSFGWGDGGMGRRGDGEDGETGGWGVGRSLRK